jgi:hypothetical protein
MWAHISDEALFPVSGNRNFNIKFNYLIIIIIYLTV